jgi:hypothetical protein
MSIVRLSGGLGNQLFQYSFAQALQKQNGENSIYDLIEYKYPSSISSHKIEILSLIKSVSINSPNTFLNLIPNRISDSLIRKNRDGLKEGSFQGLIIRRESEQLYDQSLVLCSNSYYVGNFISHQYWAGDAKQSISLVGTELEKISRLKIEVTDNSIGIHVRRGDYITNRKFRSFHGYCNDAYYLNAVKQALQAFPDLKKVSIASDSIEMVGDLKNNIEKLGVPVGFIMEKNPIIALISLARHNIFIGSNSTFSWWAAAITEKRMAYFPKDWFAFGDLGYSPKTYFPYAVTVIPDALNTD